MSHPAHARSSFMVPIAQAFVQTAEKIHKNIQDGVYELSNEVAK